MSRLRWTTKSTVKLADELAAQGHQAGPDTVARLLKDHDYSLQGNAKTIEGKQHPDRDAQFRYLNDQVTTFLTRRATGDLGRYEEEGACARGACYIPSTAGRNRRRILGLMANLNTKGI